MELALVRAPDAPGAAATGDHLAGERWDAVATDREARADGVRIAERLGVLLDEEPGDDPDAVVARHPGRRVVLVCGAETVRAYVAAVLDVDAGLLPAVDPGSVTRVRASRSGHLNLMSLNTRLHLEQRPVDVPEANHP